MWRSAWRAAVRQADAPVGIADHAADSIDTDRLITRRVAANEHCGVGGGGAFVANIACQRLARGCRQRHDVLMP